MSEPAHVIAGRCPTVFEGYCEQGGSAIKKGTGIAREQEQHGEMVVLIRPDKTG